MCVVNHPLTTECEYTETMELWHGNNYYSKASEYYNQQRQSCLNNPMYISPYHCGRGSVQCNIHFVIRMR